MRQKTGGDKANFDGANSIVGCRQTDVPQGKANVAEWPAQHHKCEVVFVHPSVTEKRESCGLAPLEALVHGDFGLYGI
jgi:hypothetical protein